MAEQRLIDANAFKEYIRNAYEETKNLYPDNGEWAKEITESFCQDIDEQPTIEPERKKGKWIEFPNHNAYKCSECGRVIETTDGKHFVYKHFPFCHCGCKMEGEQP